MSECSETESALEALMNDDRSGTEYRAAVEHVRNCRWCSEMHGLHLQLTEMAVADPGEEALSSVRREVLRRIRVEEPFTLRARVSRVVAESVAALTARPAVAAAILVALPLAGFLGGWSAGSEDVALRSFDATVIENQVEGRSPFVYSDARVRELDSGNVRLSFNVATHLDLVRSKDDPLVAEVLIQSLSGRGTLASRLKLMDAVSLIEPRVRSALTRAMLEDESLAVRLKAMARLLADTGQGRHDSDLEEAMLRVLRREDSVRMRLLAVDYLTGISISPETLRAAVTAGPDEPGTAVLARAAEYVRTF